MTNTNQKYFVAQVGPYFMVRERKGGFSIPANGGKKYRTYEIAEKYIPACDGDCARCHQYNLCEQPYKIAE